MPTWIAYLGWILIVSSLVAVGAGIGTLAERERIARRQRDRDNQPTDH